MPNAGATSVASGSPSSMQAGGLFAGASAVGRMAIFLTQSGEPSRGFCSLRVAASETKSSNAFTPPYLVVVRCRISDCPLGLRSEHGDSEPADARATDAGHPVIDGHGGGAVCADPVTGFRAAAPLCDRNNTGRSEPAFLRNGCDRHRGT